MLSSFSNTKWTKRRGSSRARIANCGLVQPVGMRNRMDGVEAQSIEAKFVQPVERIFGKVSPHLRAAEVNDVTPGGVRALLEKMRRVMREEAAFRPEVLV